MPKFNLVLLYVTDPLASADLLGDLDGRDPLAALDDQVCRAQRAAQDQQHCQRGQGRLALSRRARQPPSAGRGRLRPRLLIGRRPARQRTPLGHHDPLVYRRAPGLQAHLCRCYIAATCAPEDIVISPIPDPDMTKP